MRGLPWLLKEVTLWLLLFLVIWIVTSFELGRVVLGALIVSTIYNWRRRGYKLRYLFWG
jgi:hypothetical protein